MSKAAMPSGNPENPKRFYAQIQTQTRPVRVNAGGSGPSA